MADEIEIVVAADPAHEASQRLAAAARAGGHIVLTGGSTPRIAYEQAASLDPDWSGVQLWWGDERCVPPDDERSNFGMARAALLDRITAGAVHRIQGELGRDEGAAAYQQELEGVGSFDLVLLGLGGDGHIASLFPSEPTLDETERSAVGAIAKLQPYVDRITLTLPRLCNAEAMLFLVTGADKAEAAKRAFAGEPSAGTPGSLVRAARGATVAVLDAAAASLL
jgi:6-phosphogluconolactonase